MIHHNAGSVMSGESIRAAFRVTGFVQGVGFRYWTQRQAQRLGLQGTVRNTVDGAVEVEVLAPLNRVTELQIMLRRGPPGAIVDAVTPIAPGSAPLDPGFHVLRSRP